MNNTSFCYGVYLAWRGRDRTVDALWLGGVPNGLVTTKNVAWNHEPINKPIELCEAQ